MYVWLQICDEAFSPQTAPLPIALQGFRHCEGSKLRLSWSVCRWMSVLIRDLSRCAIGDAKDWFTLAASNESVEIIAVAFIMRPVFKLLFGQVNVWSPCLTARNCCPRAVAMSKASGVQESSFLLMRHRASF